MSGFYAGIGSRETPDDILDLMYEIAHRLGEKGWTLRSGCAPGADSAFEQGAAAGESAMELFLPWPGFEGRQWSQYYTGVELLNEPSDWTFGIAKQFHPRWESLKQGAQKLHARNVHQILGPQHGTSQTSSFVLCWTKDGMGGGGTGQALRIAKHFDVPVFDLALTATRDRVEVGLLY